MPRRREIDRWLLAATMIAASFGVVMVASASGPLAREYYRIGESEFAVRQLVAIILGAAAMVAATFVPLDRLLDKRIAFALLAVTWVALLIALFQPRVAGTHRWLQLPIGSLQPSALAKVVLPLALAAWLGVTTKAQAEQALKRRLALVVVGLTVVLVLVEPDLGSAVLLFAGAMVVLLLAGLRWRAIAATGVVAAAVVAVAIALKPYRMERVRAFFGTTGYQVQQSLIALGGGGVLGRGPGKSVQKLFFLPQPHSDFIFSIIGEELGVFGSAAVLGLLAVIVARGFAAAQRAALPSHALLAGGLTTVIAVQALLNVSVCLKLLPAKGLPLPLISAGGSDVMMTMVAIGLLLNVAKEGT